MRTITIEIAVPEGARWMTTDADGTVSLWERKPKPMKHDLYWYGEAILYRCLETDIPCPTWRDSLVDLTAPEGGGEVEG